MSNGGWPVGGETGRSRGWVPPGGSAVQPPTPPTPTSPGVPSIEGLTPNPTPGPGRPVGLIVAAASAVLILLVVVVVWTTRDDGKRAQIVLHPRSSVPARGGRPSTTVPTVESSAPPATTAPVTVTSSATTVTSSEPTVVGTPLQGVASVGAGFGSSCAVFADASMACWGRNDVGQLGDGTRESSPFPVRVTPTSSGNNPPVIGWAHACSIGVDGGVSCWGANSAGQLGDGRTTDSPKAVPVVGISDTTSLSAGGTHTCALPSVGNARCWGRLSLTGGGPGGDSLVPVEVDGTSPAIGISSGEAHVCVALQHEGTGSVVCWGANDRGQLGNATLAGSPVPVEVSGLTGVGVNAVAAGRRHTCALRAPGSVLCWGANDHGQLGDGSTADSATPRTVVGLEDATGLGTGDGFSCAARQSGRVVCWGANRDGQLGDGSHTDSSVPVPVEGLKDSFGVAVGSAHACAVTIGNMRARCWGNNAWGQLGTGSRVSSDVPVPVVTP